MQLCVYVFQVVERLFVTLAIHTAAGIACLVVACVHSVLCPQRCLRYSLWVALADGFVGAQQSQCSACAVDMLCVMLVPCLGWGAVCGWAGHRIGQEAELV